MTITQQPRRREPMRRLAAVACAAVVFTGCGQDPSPRATDLDEVSPAADEQAPPRPMDEGSAPDVHADPDPTDLDPSDPARDTSVTTLQPEEPVPVRVDIPTIAVDAELVGVGLNDDRSMEVPDFGLAGWYTKGPRPGAVGPSVIVAHYDSTAGPDVFFELGNLVAGDEVLVHREDGSVASFIVEDIEQHPKEELPGDRIWATSDEPRLTLVTCGGVFDRATGHYTDNVIVYATAGSQPP